MGERPERERSPRRAGRCRAVLLDLDDTLVPTSAIDQQAIGAAARLAAERGAGEGAAPEAIAESFKKLLRAEPFPPAGSGASLAEWRTALWARAMGRPAAEAAAVHDHWAQERLRLFVFPEEVRGLLERLKDRYPDGDRHQRPRRRPAAEARRVRCGGDLRRARRGVGRAARGEAPRLHLPHGPAAARRGAVRGHHGRGLPGRGHPGRYRRRPPRHRLGPRSAARPRPCGPAAQPHHSGALEAVLDELGSR
ncbi:unnamed protein product [Prorocentrum cordatum]|uniref:5'-nucleotidase n=1 Tax=Prorocentrum cordatum TaxID=2364126 RepID=A0ABN9U5H8_9DINO|nr:unnamed protein product [Polarella glacialis]